MKNGTSLRILNIFLNCFAFFKQGASRGAASGGSEFSEITPFFEVGMFSSDLEAKPQMLSTVSVLGKAVRKKSEKHRASTPERFSRDVFLTFSGLPHANHLLLRRFVDGRGPKLVSKVSDSYQAV